MKYLLGILMVLIIVVGGWWFVSHRTNSEESSPSSKTTTGTSPNVKNDAESGKTVTFVCAEGKSIIATFYPEQDNYVDLSLSDGRVLSVPHAISASGARYANADESFVFWNKGNTAFVTEGDPNVQTFSDCVLLTQ